MLGVPDNELMVRFSHRIHGVHIHLHAGSTASGTITEFAQAGYLAHDIGRIVCRDVVDTVVRLVGGTKEKLIAQFFLE